jgi:hypothetical protein
VTEVAPGDFVVLNWRAVCGQCRACRRGRPWYCFATPNAAQKMSDGTQLAPALGIGAFAEKTLVAAGQCTKVPQARPEAVGLLGCGVMAGLGAAINTGGVTRGDSVGRSTRRGEINRAVRDYDVENEVVDLFLQEIRRQGGVLIALEKLMLSALVDGAEALNRKLYAELRGWATELRG